jgi:hypothetical protein
VTPARAPSPAGSIEDASTLQRQLRALVPGLGVDPLPPPPPPPAAALQKPASLPDAAARAEAMRRLHALQAEADALVDGAAAAAAAAAGVSAVLESSAADAAAGRPAQSGGAAPAPRGAAPVRAAALLSSAVEERLERLRALREQAAQLTAGA